MAVCVYHIMASCARVVAVTCVLAWHLELLKRCRGGTEMYRKLRLHVHLYSSCVVDVRVHLPGCNATLITY